MSNFEIMKRFFLLFLFFLYGSNGIISAQSEKPNIIYIMADDLGYGDLGCYGQTKIKTPEIDKMARGGMLFTQHYAGSTVCMPSRAVLLTGKHTGHASVRGNPLTTATGNPVNLPKSEITVADQLKKAGYNTAIIGKWGLSEGTFANMPSEHGFDYFFGYKDHSHAHHYYYDKLYRNKTVVRLEENNPRTKQGQYVHDLLTEEAMNYIKEQKENPFFLYLSFTIPHLEMTVPQDSKKPYMKLGWPERKMEMGHYRNDQEGNTTYAGMVSRMDGDVGKILDLLRKLEIDDNTLVIFTSDNGHQYDTGFFDSNGPLRGKKRDLYEGGIRVPFIAWWPGKVKEGTATNHISAFWDFLPTASDLAGVESPENIDGLSYLPTLLGQESHQEDHEYLYWEFNEGAARQALRKGYWKLVKYSQKPYELYNLVTDIEEENDLSKKYPEKLEELKRIARNARTEHPAFPLKD